MMFIVMTTEILNNAQHLLERDVENTGAFLRPSALRSMMKDENA